MSEPNHAALRYRRASVICLAVLSVIAVSWMLRVTAIVAMPLTLALFLTLLLRPLQRRLTVVLPHWLSLALTMATLLAVLAAVLTIFWFSIRITAERAPHYAQALQGAYTQLRVWAHQYHLHLPYDPLLNAELRQRLLHIVSVGLTSIWAVGVASTLVFFMILLMLLEADEWAAKMQEAFAQPGKFMLTFELVTTKLRQYLRIYTMVSLASGVAGGLWLWLIQIDFALLWGVIMFLFNYVPNVGSIIAVIPPVIVAWIQHGFGWAMLTLAGLIASEQVIGNFIAPRLEGRRMAMSPVFLLVSVVFWTMMWGVAGAVLAVPIAVTVVVVCAQITALRPLAVLLSRPGAVTDLAPKASDQN